MGKDLKTMLREEQERVALQRTAAFHGFDTKSVVATDLSVLRKLSQFSPEFSARKFESPDEVYRRAINWHLRVALHRYDEIAKLYSDDEAGLKKMARDAGVHRVPKIRELVKRIQEDEANSKKHG